MVLMATAACYEGILLLFMNSFHGTKDQLGLMCCLGMDLYLLGQVCLQILPTAVQLQVSHLIVPNSLLNSSFKIIWDVEVFTGYQSDFFKRQVAACNSI